MLISGKGLFGGLGSCCEDDRVGWRGRREGDGRLGSGFEVPREEG